MTGTPAAKKGKEVEGPKPKADHVLVGNGSLVIIGSRSAWKPEIIVRELYFDQGPAYFMF